MAMRERREIRLWGDNLGAEGPTQTGQRQGRRSGKRRGLGQGEVYEDHCALHDKPAVKAGSGSQSRDMSSGRGAKQPL